MNAWDVSFIRPFKSPQAASVIFLSVQLLQVRYAKCIYQSIFKWMTYHFRSSLCSESLNSRGHEEVHKQDGKLSIASIAEAECHAWLGVERGRLTHPNCCSGEQCMKVEIRDNESMCSNSLICFFFTGHVTHFRLQRHFTGKHEVTVGSKRSVVFKSTCA